GAMTKTGKLGFIGSKPVYFIFTGDDDLAGDGGIHGTRTEDEAVGVVEDEVDGLAADEPDLPRLRHGAGGHAAQIVWFFHVAAIADRVLRITVLPQGADVGEQDVRI